MKRYVDGYVIPIARKDLAAYKKLAVKAGKVWMKHGALQYTECVGDDFKSVLDCYGVSFTKLAKTKKNETVIFAFVVYKSRAHRDKVNKKVMQDPAMNPSKWEKKKIPFDMKRMAWAGFTSLVNYEK